MKPEELQRLYEEPLATQLEAMRAEARSKRRLTFDCYNTRERGDRVICWLGIMLHNDSLDCGLPLLSVLKGRSALICQKCKFYSDDKEEGKDDQND